MTARHVSIFTCDSPEILATRFYLFASNKKLHDIRSHSEILDIMLRQVLRRQTMRSCDKHAPKIELEFC